MEHSVQLEQLPADLKFPDELQSKIRYDAEKRVLVFNGPMGRQDFDRLWPLHSDSAYRRAVEDLFRIATWDAEEAGTASAKRSVKLAVVITAILIVAVVALCILCL